MPISVYILEERSLSTGMLSARTTRLTSGAMSDALVLYRAFATAVEFDAALLDLAAAITQPHRGLSTKDRVHIVIISAHGMELTGTTLYLSGGDAPDLDEQPSINFHFYDRYFQTLPAPCIVYLSACWGAYPGPISVFSPRRPPQGSPHHTFVGPLVAIRGPHAIEMQNAIIDLASACAAPNLAAQLTQAVIQFNAKWHTDYGEPALRIVASDGTWTPAQGEAGLAAPIQRSKCQLVALHDYDESQKTASTAVLWDGKLLWTVPYGTLHELAVGGDPRTVIGMYIDVRAKVHHPAHKPAETGRAELLRAKRIGKPPSTVPPYQARYAHMQEWPTAPASNDFEMLPTAVGRACGACNSASLKWQMVIVGNAKRLVVSARCRRADCPERESDPS